MGVRVGAWSRRTPENERNSSNPFLRADTRLTSGPDKNRTRLVGPPEGRQGKLQGEKNDGPGPQAPSGAATHIPPRDDGDDDELAKTMGAQCQEYVPGAL